MWEVDLMGVDPVGSWSIGSWFSGSWFRGSWFRESWSREPNSSCALCENTLKTTPHQSYPCSQNGKAVWIRSKNHSLPTSSYSPDRLPLLLYLYRQPSGQGEILTITARRNDTTCRTSFKTSPHQLHWTLFWQCTDTTLVWQICSWPVKPQVDFSALE